jgi:RNA recognition motif-containing protein
MTNKVFVGNLPWSVRTEQLSDFLSDLGFTYRSVKVIEDRETQRSRGFAFVEFETPEAAAEAIRDLTGAVCEGRTLFANEAKDARPSGGGGRVAPRESSRAETGGRFEQRPRSKSNKHRRGKPEEDYGWGS